MLTDRSAPPELDTFDRALVGVLVRGIPVAAAIYTEVEHVHVVGGPHRYLAATAFCLALIPSVIHLATRRPDNIDSMVDRLARKVEPAVVSAAAWASLGFVSAALGALSTPPDHTMATLFSAAAVLGWSQIGLLPLYVVSQWFRLMADDISDALVEGD